MSSEEETVDVSSEEELEPSTDPTLERSALYEHYPAFFSSDFFEPLLEEIQDKAVGYSNTIFGKSYPSKRASCFVRSLNEDFSSITANAGPPSTSSKYFSYGDLESFDWSDVPIITTIKETLEERFDTHYDYCLVHIYRNGKDNISWHSDKEALNTSVMSVSFGATRTFRMRKIGKSYERGEVEDEFKLGSGDAFHMLPGCQRVYVHTVPSESAVKDIRINLTFREFDAL